jgi:hypothetical protein
LAAEVKMLSPVQNQDMLQRSDTLSTLRSLESAKVLGDMHRSAVEMRAWERQFGQTVQEQENSHSINPDGGSGKRQDQDENRHKQFAQEFSDEDDIESAHPAYLEGGDVIDIVA